jgi:hypothetical protein
MYTNQWVKDFNVKMKILKVLEENSGMILEDIGIRSDILNRNPITQE